MGYRSVLGEGCPLGLPAGPLGFMLCVRVRTSTLARLLLGHVVLWRGAVSAGAFYQCVALYPLVSLDPLRTVIVSLAAFPLLDLVTLPQTALLKLSARFEYSMSVEEPLWFMFPRAVQPFAGMLSILVALASIHHDSWSLARVAFVAAGAALWIVFNLYELWLVRSLLFPRTREELVRVRHDVWVAGS